MCIDLGRDSLTQRFCSFARGSLESLSDTARGNLEAGVWNAVTCLSQHEHTVLQSRGVFLWQPAV